MKKNQILEIFKNLADISHDNDGYTCYDKYKSHDIIDAISETKFIEAAEKIKLLVLDDVSKSKRAVKLTANATAYNNGYCRGYEDATIDVGSNSGE